MALTQNFTATQVAGSPSEIVITDTSTGTDVAVTQRRVYLITASGEYLVPDGTTTDYVEWGDFPATTTITIDALTKDYALSVKVDWLNVSNSVLYTKTTKYGFTLYNETFDYGLTQLLAGNPLLINDNNFFSNKSLLRVNIDDGDNAISFAGDLYAAQQSYDRATELRLNSQYYFNGNS